MKKLIIGENGCAITFDTDAQTVVWKDASREAISRVYLIAEPTTVVYEGKEYETNEGDIVVKFYDSDFPNRVVIVHSPEWKENIDAYNERQRVAMLSLGNCESCDDCEMAQTPCAA